MPFFNQFLQNLVAAQLCLLISERKQLERLRKFTRINWTSSLSVRNSHSPGKIVFPVSGNPFLGAH